MKHYRDLTSLKGSDQGFTIQELLVAMVISLVVLTGIYQTFRSQQDSFIMQEQIAATQQNLRGGMFIMESEIRMAGANPTGTVSPDPGFLVAGSGTVQFTKDITGGESDTPVDNDGDMSIDEADEVNFGDGDVLDANENITYSLSGGSLMRNGVMMAENIDALDFVFMDKDGVPLNAFGGSVAAGSLPDIRTVQITMVARTGRSVRGSANNIAYENQRPGGSDIIYTAPGDRVSRRALTVTIKCRNM